MERSEKANTSEYYNILITPSMDMFLPAMVTMLSAMKNAGRPCHFYIMQSDFGEENKEAYRKLVGNYPGNQIDLIDVNDEDFQIFDRWRGHYTPYYHLAASRYLPMSIERILYLDCDVYVKKFIGQFYNMDFEDYPVISCENVCLKSERDRIIAKGVEKQGLVCTGVVLWNVRKVREQGPFLEDYAAALSKFKGSYLADQGLLWCVLGQRIKIVPSYKYEYQLSHAGSAKAQGTYRWIFTRTPEERRELVREMYYSEEFDPEQAEMIVHFAGGSPKPWTVIAEISEKGVNGIKDIPDIGKVGPSLTKDDLEKFYLDWWNIALELPKEYFQQLLVESTSNYYNNILRKKDQAIRWKMNAQNFCQALCLDYLGERKFDRFLKNIAGKDLAVLKFQDEAGTILMKAASAYGVNVTLQSSKGTLDGLSAEEFDTCRRADCIISCSVHGVVKTHERDGVKCIVIWDILRDDSLTKDLPAVPEVPSETLAVIADEARHAKEICQNIEKLAQN